MTNVFVSGHFELISSITTKQQIIYSGVPAFFKPQQTLFVNTH